MSLFNWQQWICTFKYLFKQYNLQLTAAQQLSKFPLRLYLWTAKSAFLTQISPLKKLNCPLNISMKKVHSELKTEFTSANLLLFLTLLLLWMNPPSRRLIHSSKYLSPQISLCTTPTIIHPGCLNTCVIKKQPPNPVSPIRVPTAIHPHNRAVTELSSFFHSPDIYWTFPVWLPLFQWLGFSSTQN